MNKVLIVVDMQNDFIDGALGTPEALAIVENVKEKIKSYNADSIFVTRDTHSENYLETQEGKMLPVEHCIKDTHGWEIREDINALLTGTRILDKPTFGSRLLADWLEFEYERAPFEIEIVGLCTDICVVSNALLIKATLPEAQITVDSSCCAGSTPENHAAALTTMKNCQIKII